MEKIINCPHCGKEMRLSFNADEIAPGDTIEERQCPHCNKKAMFTVSRKNEVMVSTDYKCPQCGSENIQVYKLVYMGGTASFNAVSAGGGVVGNSVAGGVAVTSGASQTYLAESASPPRKIGSLGIIVWSIVIGMAAFVITSSYFQRIISDKPNLALVNKVLDAIPAGFRGFFIKNPTLIGLIVFLIHYGIIFIVPLSIAVISGVFLFRWRRKYNTKIFSAKYREWWQSFICLRCGTIFVLKR